MEFRYKYGLLGAGAVAKSLVGKLPSRTRDLGPVSAVSYRVASRIANALRAGHAVRTATELDAAGVILFHAPPDQAETLLESIENAGIEWSGRALIFCDCDLTPAVRASLAAMGASTAVARQLGIPGRIAVAGAGPALSAAHGIARDLKLKPVEILPAAIDVFDAAITLGTTAITPLIDCAVSLLKNANIRDTEAAKIAYALFLQTANDYAHSGKQSWAWYMRKPDVIRIESQIAAAGEQAGPVLRELLLFGLRAFDKYPEVCAAVRAKTIRSK